MEYFLVLAILVAPVFHYFWKEKKLSCVEHESEEDRLKRENEHEEWRRRADDIESARDETEDLNRRGAIFEINTTSGVRGYHVKELGWVRCECDERSAAEQALRRMAAKKYKSANVLTKLSHNISDERYVAGSGPNGKPYYRTQRVKIWEAMAGEAIQNGRVDKSPVLYNHKEIVIDGSNVAHWGYESAASLDAVRAIIRFVNKEGAIPIVIFDANIGFKVAKKYMSIEELAKSLGGEVEIEIVESGTVADRRIFEMAEQRNAVVVSNDLFRDSIRARHIPKRRGFYLAKYDYAELLNPRL